MTPAGAGEHADNAANQLVGLANKNAADTVLASYGTMRYLGTGDLATVTSTIPGATSLAGVVDYAYDRKRQLTLDDSDRAGGYDFANAFDGAGNATTFRDGAQTFNADNQLTGTGYVYDGNGNPTTFGGTTLAFDVENRLTAYGTALTAGYRGDGLRAWKETSAGRTYFLYDGIRIVGELDADGDLIAASTYGAAGLLSRGTTQYQFDPLGDAVLLLDGSGTVTANRLFDAWGNELTAVAEPYGYRAQHGYYADGETGLIALAFRYYAPGVGRFVNRDPIGYEGGINVYLLAGANPVTNADPLGLISFATLLSLVPGLGTILNFVTNPRGSEVADYKVSISQQACCEDATSAEYACVSSIAVQATTFTANYFSTTSLHGIVDAVVGIMVHYPPVWLALALDFILDTIASGIGYNKISDAARSAKLPCDCSRFSCDCE